MFIYLIVNHETGKYYVGQHKGKNLQHYLQQKMSSARHKTGSSHLFNSMRKYPQSSLWSIHALCSDIQTRKELDETEREFIKFLRSQDPEYGYNICRGGEGRTGPLGLETRQKMAIHSKQMWKDPQFRIRHAESMKKALLNPEYHEKRSILSRRNWANIKFRSKIMAAQASANADPMVRAKLSKVTKRSWSNPEIRAKKIKALREALSNPEYCIKHTKAMQSPEVRSKLSESIKDKWKDEDYRSAVLKASQSSECRTNLLEAREKAMAYPERHAKWVEAMRKSWANPEIRVKRVAAIREGRHLPPTEPPITHG
jgi:hypothetical protein